MWKFRRSTSVMSSGYGARWIAAWMPPKPPPTITTRCRCASAIGARISVRGALASVPVRNGRRDLLRTVAEGTAGAVGDEFLRCLVRHVALAFDAKFAFVAEATDPSGEHARVLSGWYGDDWLDEPFEYDTGGKPC